MKKIFFAALALLSMVCCSSAKGYVVEGKIGNENGKVSIVDMVSDETLATADVVNGKFTLNVDSDTPVFATLVVNDVPMTSIMLDGSPLKVTQNEGDKVIYVSGTPANEAYTKFIIEGDRLVAKMQDSSLSQEEQAAAQNEIMEVMFGSYEDNKDNLFGAYMLCSSIAPYLEAAEMLEAVEGFPEEIQQMAIMQQCKEMALAMLKTEVGNVYTNVTAANADGEEVSLASVVAESKYVLLDFWASWCRPCMGEMPYLRDAYAKYHAKGFEIYGVSLDDNVGAWKKAMQSQKMVWVNVHDATSAAATAYSVSSIPTNFLIESSTGKIVAKNLRGEALEEKLAELF